MTTSTKVLLVVAIIILLGGLGYGAFWLSKHSSGNQKSTHDSSKNAASDPNGPYYHQIYSATSTDGLTWVKQDKLLFDHASVPGAIIKDGIIYLYFVDAGGQGDQLSVAVSKDSGKTFDKKTVKIKGSDLSPVDPDPQLLESNKIRLYYFASPMQSGDPAQASGNHKIFSAESSDGITFENPQVAFEEENITDPDAFKTTKDWRMFISRGTQMDLAISNNDGITFQKQNNFTWDQGGISSTINTGGTFRTYFCGKEGIASAIGADTGTLTLESGIRIQETEKIVCDPSVVQLPDGSFLMFYKTMTPSQNSGGGQPTTAPLDE